MKPFSHPLTSPPLWGSTPVPAPRRHLNDRIHTRPFLSSVEKKWLSFQVRSNQQPEVMSGNNLASGDEVFP